MKKIVTARRRNARSLESYSLRRSLSLLALVFAAWISSARADVRMPGIFGDHMVLQQGINLPVWGWASPGEQVKVTLAGQSATTTAASDGKWKVSFPPFSAGNESQTLAVAGRNTVTFTDVLIGEVWLAGGQSNMEFGIQTDLGGPEAIAQATDSQIRFFFVPWATAFEPQPDIAAEPAGAADAGGSTDAKSVAVPPARLEHLNGKWLVCSPEVMGANWGWHGFSAIGYYFAQEVRKITRRPVGMIASYKGATAAEAWTSIASLKKSPVLAHYARDQENIIASYAEKQRDYPQRQADFAAALRAWNAKYELPLKEAEDRWKVAADQAGAAGQPIPPRPNPPERRPNGPRPPDGGFNSPGNLFNGMIAPIVPYGIRGVIWYQGETNGDTLAAAKEYPILFPHMIADWRAQWNEGDFPFLYVQLANYKALTTSPVDDNTWPWVREAQLKTLSVPNTAMASSIDVGEVTDIHPRHKLDVAVRLALAARHLAYGENLVYSGPIYRSMMIEGDKIRLTFSDAGSGLTLGRPPWIAPSRQPASAALEGFGIAGEDRHFVWAKATLEGNSVVVHSDQVPKPVAVRYDWAINPPGNLYNQEGLPASPFRTDDW